VSALKLVIFDVDGTLIDSQGSYLAALSTALRVCGETVHEGTDPLSVVGLSPVPMFQALLPHITVSQAQDLSETYKDAYRTLRSEGRAEVAATLYPGARDVLQTLHGREDFLLGTATGKAMRGLRVAYDAHNLNGIFVTHQTADLHPSKPHPSMIEAALSETGVAAADAVMIGDTSYDLEMAKNAGVHAIGVSWGYQPRARLLSAGACTVVDGYEHLIAAIDQLWRKL
jgi:phosphoglycolate phosphatase